MRIPIQAEVAALPRAVVAARPIAGEAVPGDLHLVQPFERGVLLAAIDGVGHGAEATTAAQMAAAILERHAQETVISLVNRCHQALRQTRGVVMTVASLDAVDNTITWLGVGNVAGLLLRAEPGASGNDVNYVFPTFVMTRMPVGLIGLLIAAIFAAAMSTLSSSLNSSSAAAMADFYLPLAGEPRDFSTDARALAGQDRDRLRRDLLLCPRFACRAKALHALDFEREIGCERFHDASHPSSRPSGRDAVDNAEPRPTQGCPCLMQPALSLGRRRVRSDRSERIHAERGGARTPCARKPSTCSAFVTSGSRRRVSSKPEGKAVS